MAEIKKFLVGKEYGCRSFCDYDCIFTFTVVRRTAKTVWLKNAYGEITGRRVNVYNETEHVAPHGHYSMSPVLGADDMYGEIEPEVVAETAPKVAPEVIEFPAPFTVIIGGLVC